jgi:hypothetical protein
MGRVVVLKVDAVALDGPVGSGALSVVSLGMEFVVDTLGGRPGWYGAPDVRPRLTEPFLIGDLVLLVSLYCGEVITDRISPPPMGISPDVGVGKEYSGEFDE